MFRVIRRRGCFSLTDLLLIVGGDSWNALLMFQHVLVMALEQEALRLTVFV